MSEPKLNVAERDQLLRELNIRLSNIEREQMASLTLKNKELSRNNKMAGQEFLEKNKLREGVRVLQRSGIQYKSIVTGNGPVSDFNDTVVVHYNGYLIDGTKFDSSYDRDEPITMSIDKFIEGWQKILSIMPVGSKWEVFIPHNLAYGESGVGGPDDHVIPPGSTLVFEMELIEIVD
jgi:FKBP-type peptidyl-prolyl cis-trans isomerase FklB